jgi:hypothetical protein
LEFHVHIDAFQLVVKALLDENPIGKINQHVMYSSRLFNLIEINDIIIERKAMVYALHKFMHYLLGNMFTLCGPYGFIVFGQQATSF